MDPAVIKLVETLGTAGPFVALMFYLLRECQQERKEDSRSHWEAIDGLRERMDEHFHELRDLVKAAGHGAGQQGSGRTP